MALDPITAILDVGGKLLDKFVPDPQAKAAAQIELIKLAQSADLAQIGVNQQEAGSTSVFVAGWRPWIGWVCGAAFAWNFVGISIARFALEVAGRQVALAPADLTEMMPVLLGMLGLAGLRTQEKIKGVAR